MSLLDNPVLMSVVKYRIPGIQISSDLTELTTT